MRRVNTSIARAAKAAESMRGTSSTYIKQVGRISIYRLPYNGDYYLARDGQTVHIGRRLLTLRSAESTAAKINAQAQEAHHE